MAVEAANPRLYKLQPTKGPQDGGTSVTLSGTDFRYGTTMCQFGTSSAIQASYISQTSVVCISPAGPAAGAASVTVEVTSDNSGSADTYSTDGLLFAYQGENPYTVLAASVLRTLALPAYLTGLVTSQPHIAFRVFSLQRGRRQGGQELLSPGRDSLMTTSCRAALQRQPIVALCRGGSG